MRAKNNRKKKEVKTNTVNNEFPEDSKSSVSTFSTLSVKLFNISPAKFNLAMKYNGLEEDSEINYREAKKYINKYFNHSLIRMEV